MKLTTGQKIVSETSVSNCCLSPVLEWCVVDDSTHTIGLKRMCAKCKSEYIHLVEKSVLEQLLVEAERRAVEKFIKKIDNTNINDGRKIEDLAELIDSWEVVKPFLLSQLRKEEPKLSEKGDER